MKNKQLSCCDSVVVSNLIINVLINSESLKCGCIIMAAKTTQCSILANLYFHDGLNHKVRR